MTTDAIILYTGIRTIAEKSGIQSQRVEKLSISSILYVLASKAAA
jgi:hypothetical protein